MFVLIPNPEMVLNPDVVRDGGTPVTPIGNIGDQAGGIISINNPYQSPPVIGGVPDDWAQRASDPYVNNPGGANYPVPGVTPSQGTSQYYNNYSSARSFEYVNAELAKHYKMNKATAYNEAMANTAYQRAVVDMQQAGLNPAAIFGAGRASSAGSGYASGGSSGGFSSASGAAKGNQLPGWIYYGVQALAQIVGSVATHSFSGGYAASQIASTLLKAFNGR